MVNPPNIVPFATQLATCQGPKVDDCLRHTFNRSSLQALRLHMFQIPTGDHGDEAPRYLSDDGEDEASEVGTWMFEDVGVQGSALLSAVSSLSHLGSPASL